MPLKRGRVEVLTWNETAAGFLKGQSILGATTAGAAATREMEVSKRVATVEVENNILSTRIYHYARLRVGGRERDEEGMNFPLFEFPSRGGRSKRVNAKIDPAYRVDAWRTTANLPENQESIEVD